MTNSNIFRVASYNCKGFKFRNFEYIRKLFDKVDFLLIQEHWLYDFEFDMFSKVLPNCMYKAKSGMENTTINLGRPFSGVAIIWKNYISIKMEEIITVSDRLCAVRLQRDNVDIILINVYMPCNNAVYDEKFTDIIFEILTISNMYDCSDIIIGGDFNCNLSLNNTRAVIFNEFINVSELNCITLEPQFDIQYTFIDSLQHKSLIDHFCISSRIKRMSNNCFVLDDGDNLSDHLPLIIHVELDLINVDNAIRMNIDNNESPVFKVCWSDATDADIDEYKYVLDKLLNDINLPVHDVINCLDVNCLTHRNEFSEFLSNILESIELATLATIPVKYKNNSCSKKSKLLAGWCSYVKTYHDRSIFWHKIWKDCGRPEEGYVADIRRCTRSDYHGAVKDLKSNQDRIINNKVAKSLKNSNPKFFWREINHLNYSVKNSSQIIDGKKNADVSEIFKTKYEQLYNKDKNDSLNDILQLCCTNIEGICVDRESNIIGSHLHCINFDMIKKAVKRLKSSKKEVINDIFSDALLQGSSKLFEYLAIMYTIMLRHGYTDNIFDVIYFSPLVKNKRKDLSDSNNYRAIALNSLFSKIIDYVFIDFFPNIFRSSDYQFAYKKDFSTTLCSFIMTETIQYYRKRSSNVIVTLLDCSKAFDLVNYRIIFNELVSRGLCPLACRLLVVFYSCVEGKVRWNNHFSNDIKIRNGVKQGGVMSPLLFSLYVDELILRIHNARVGCFIGNKCSSVLIYADDIALLTPTRNAMQKLLKICEEFGKDYCLNYNPDKSETIIFGNSSFNCNLTLNNENIKQVNRIVHLGHVMKNDRYIFDLSPMIDDIKIRSNVIHSKFNVLDLNSRIKIFNSQCSSFYGSQLIDLQNRQLDNLDRCWRVCSRRILRVNNRTHCNVLPQLMNVMKPSMQITSRILTFYLQGFNNESDFISFYFRNCFN